MSLDKGIKHGKEHRRTYRERGQNAAEHVMSCRPHGGCAYCQRSLNYRGNRLAAAANDDMKTWRDAA